MDSQDYREHLPLRLERNFRPWSYQVTQRRLELRSDNNFHFGETVFAVFLDVLAMQVRRSYKGLEIGELTNPAAIEQFADIPERHRDRFMKLSVGDHAHEGFVVCAVFETRIEPPAL